MQTRLRGPDSTIFSPEQTFYCDIGLVGSPCPLCTRASLSVSPPLAPPSMLLGDSHLAPTLQRQLGAIIGDPVSRHEWTSLLPSAHLPFFLTRRRSHLPSRLRSPCTLSWSLSVPTPSGDPVPQTDSLLSGSRPFSRCASLLRPFLLHSKLFMISLCSLSSLPGSV